jgi:hypothetical protein
MAGLLPRRTISPACRFNPTRFTPMKIHLRYVLAIALLLTSAALRAEKVDLATDELKETATHIIVGPVLNIYEQTTVSPTWRVIKYVAEVRVEKIEKFDKVSPLKVGELLYVRYWKQMWVGQGVPPVDTSGHRGLPAVGSNMRIYLSRDAYDGFNENGDGGYNVIGANGFESLDSPPATPVPAESPPAVQK